MTTQRAKRALTNLFPGAWVLAAVILSVVFIVAVDWFATALLHVLFGAGQDDDLLLNPISITIANAFGKSVSFSLNALSLSLITFALYAIFWSVRSRIKQRAIGDQSEFSSSAPLTSKDKLRLLAFLVFLAIALGWFSSALEQALIGDIGALEGINAGLKWTFTALYLVALASFYYIAKRSNSSWKRLILPTAVILALVLLTWTDLIADVTSRAALLFGMLAVAWGYILFQQVRYHAVPVNFMRAVHKDPSRQQHLVCFVSSNRLSIDTDNLTVDGFSEKLQNDTRDELDSTVLASLLAGIESWKLCVHKDSPSRIIPKSFAKGLIEHLISFYGSIVPTSGNAPQQSLSGASIKDKIQTDLSNKERPSRPWNAGFYCDLLAVHLIATLLKTVCPKIQEEVPLGDLICWFQKITASKLNWLMPILSVEFHHGVRGEDSAGTAILQNATFIFSRDRDETQGSVRSALCFAWLMQVLFRQYYDTSEQQLQFTYLRPTSANEAASLGDIARILSQDQKEVLSCGIDFESYEECSQAIRDIIDRLRVCDQGNIVIDFTGGQKTSTMAAVLATTCSDVKSQYISTNGYQFYGFDLRYYDMQALLS